MKVSVKRPVEHLSYSSDHYGVEEALVEVHERIKVRVSKTDVGIWIDGVKYVQFLPESVTNTSHYDLEPVKKRPPHPSPPPPPPKRLLSEDVRLGKSRHTHDQHGAKKRMELDPVSVFWNGIYENFRNIIKNFWRD